MLLLMRRNKRMTSHGVVTRSLVAVLALRFIVVAATTATAAADPATVEEQECTADGTCTSSSIPLPPRGGGGEPSAEKEERDDQAQPHDEPYCALYLAESTIPGAGMGIFTFEEKRKGETISRGDLCIPFIDMYWYV
jgi:hypothetical protein